MSLYTLPFCRRNHLFYLVCLSLLLIARSGAAQAAAPKIDSVTVLQQPPSPSLQNPVSASQNPATATQTFVLEVHGSGLNITHTPVVFPAKGVTDLHELGLPAGRDASTDLWIEFTAPGDYVPQEIFLSIPSGPGAPGVEKTIATGFCDASKNVKSTFFVINQSQANDKYGRGVAANFHVIQVSIVNECAVPVIVPLAGIKLLPKPTGNAGKASSKKSAGKKDGVGNDKTGETDSADDSAGAATASPSLYVPLSLDHVTSIYSMDRALTGARAIYFNVLLGLVTLGGAVEPFFGKSFGRTWAQGVSVAGGGFTEASKDIFKDMSAEQLQNITSQSFGSTEQLGPQGGSLQKFIFVPNSCGLKLLSFTPGRRCTSGEKAGNDPAEQAIRQSNFQLSLEVIAASTQAATSQAKPATPSKAKPKGT